MKKKEKINATADSWLFFYLSLHQYLIGAGMMTDNPLINIIHNKNLFIQNIPFHVTVQIFGYEPYRQHGSAVNDLRRGVEWFYCAVDRRVLFTYL